MNAIFKWTFSISRKVHRDESGSISVVSVFTFLFLTMVLGMVINLGRQTNRKVKLQNAADASTYSGGVVVARSMNTLAFTNHLLCDVFALTAYLREARDRNAESLSPTIFAQWDHMAPLLRGTPLKKFSILGRAIPKQTKLEAQFIKIFGDQNAAVSERLLPVMEEILAKEMIPEFQRALVWATPELANEVANEIASRHGPSDRGLNRGEEMAGLMWCTDGSPFGERQSQSSLPQLPASDPVNDRTAFQPQYFRRGINEREVTSNEYLRQLNNTMLVDFGRIGKMSQFKPLWEGFTRGYLRELLVEEYPDRNIPYQIRIDPAETNQNQYVGNDFMSVGAVYWRQMDENMPGLFKNPLDADGVAFSQIQLFIPRNRLRVRLDLPPERRLYRQSYPMHRDLMNQNWTIQLVPATAKAIPQIVSTDPPMIGTETPNLGGLSTDEFRHINTH
ncbi:MAG: Tad domain-containing protein [Mariniblastus sp.]